MIYESFESDEVTKTGKVPMPKLREKDLGGHAVMAVGYNDATKSFIVMNSWSTKWDDKGFFYMLYAYLITSDLSDDFWKVRVVEV